MSKSLLLVACSLGVAGLSPLTSQSLAARADSVFTAYRIAAVPGCAVGVDQNGLPLLRAAYGQANLEHPVLNTPSTIFEAGSVAKQFTAAAVLLLVARNQLALSDSLQKWFPEFPQYDATITIAHLLQHTSGLRDWGAIADLAGWPRGSRAATQADALDIMIRQRGLNHPPGTSYSYTNSGYNLLAMLIERITGESLAEFTKQEFFVPLGMSHTSWRDDFARVVPGRAQAYRRQGNSWVLDMPFENAHGNGGLLTTVGDLLIWNRALNEGRIGNPDVSTAMQASGHFNDGKPVGYGGGLSIGLIREVPAVSHTGSTAGYRAVLAHFPDQEVNVAILCNAADAAPATLAQAMLSQLVPFGPRTSVQGSPLKPIAAPGRETLQGYVGTWQSDEAQSLMRIELAGSNLMLHRRPGAATSLRPLDVDRFSGPAGISFRFERDSNGEVSGLRVSIPRAVDIPFQRISK
jgi:CubicO group peptidase (beta-lactamase class C family)